MAGLSLYKFGMVCWCDKPVTEEDRDCNMICGERPVVIIQEMPICLRKATVMPLGGNCLTTMDAKSGIKLDEFQTSFMKPYDIGPIAIRYLKPLGMLSDDDIVRVKEVIAQYFGVNSSHDVLPERAYFADIPLTMSLHRSSPFNWKGLTYKGSFVKRLNNEEIDRPMDSGTDKDPNQLSKEGPKLFTSKVPSAAPENEPKHVY